jgi:hypothetical protein
MTSSCTLAHITMRSGSGSLLPGTERTTAGPSGDGVLFAQAPSSRPDRPAKLVASDPLRHAGTADEVAEAILGLLSPASACVIGSVIDVSGGRLTVPLRLASLCVSFFARDLGLGRPRMFLTSGARCRQVGDADSGSISTLPRANQRNPSRPPAQISNDCMKTTCRGHHPK